MRKRRENYHRAKARQEISREKKLSEEIRAQSRLFLQEKRPLTLVSNARGLGGTMERIMHHTAGMDCKREFDLSAWE
ncbi:hypothetical protein DB347_05755 [Opitutaceae bacterium EW11]|nr:hypothetical protein DB347_05755 [Opitutaceae bacterium EW11]